MSVAFPSWVPALIVISLLFSSVTALLLRTIFHMSDYIWSLSLSPAPSSTVYVEADLEMRSTEAGTDGQRGPDRVLLRQSECHALHQKEADSGTSLVETNCAKVRGRAAALGMSWRTIG